MREIKIDKIDQNFEDILICAMRYSLGRMSYMPDTVMEYITPLLPELSERALYVIVRDLTDFASEHKDDYYADEWNEFLENVNIEYNKRKGVAK